MISSVKNSPVRLGLTGADPGRVKWVAWVASHLPPLSAPKTWCAIASQSPIMLQYNLILPATHLAKFVDQPLTLLSHAEPNVL